MESRVVFAGRLFPALLLIPQLAVTIVFFFWPAGQALAAARITSSKAWRPFALAMQRWFVAGLIEPEK
jgi:hypothetical protein